MNHHRIIRKNGQCNIQQNQMDFYWSYNKLIDSSWCSTLFLYLIILLSSWCAFGALYWVICDAHGDFDPNHLPELQEASNHTPCIYEMYNFASCFLFSIEAQHTVGYGIRAPTEECSEAIFVNIIQCIVGFIMQGFMAAIIFAKMTLPKFRSTTMMFSKRAVITTRNDVKYFMFRIGDIRKSYVSNPSCRAFYVHTELTAEGETLKGQQKELKLKADGCCGDFFFSWPLVMVHEIDEHSPLYQLQTNKDQFEIVVVLEGDVDSTGQTTQGRTSYTIEEIVLEANFENMMSINRYKNGYEIDFSKFDILIPKYGE
ncbi:ATP-sensitive inward rectifier potassium channel 12 [Aethina tumida]|uniref:ATP-sensitive inward rectifier potassium channel 12 n=1 Tax=Aethina tumida TaxID=116153 RepID=UPI00214759F0|nr:ATP-sensitive inward rectifier potassium channel 12 [Aethina tumida]